MEQGAIKKIILGATVLIASTQLGGCLPSTQSAIKYGQDVMNATVVLGKTTSESVGRATTEIKNATATGRQASEEGKPDAISSTAKQYQSTVTRRGKAVGKSAANLADTVTKPIQAPVEKLGEAAGKTINALKNSEQVKAGIDAAKNVYKKFGNFLGGGGN